MTKEDEIQVRQRIITHIIQTCLRPISAGLPVGSVLRKVASFTGQPHVDLSSVVPGILLSLPEKIVG